jgi:hypothetical protein
MVGVHDLVGVLWGSARFGGRTAGAGREGSKEN